MSLKATVAPLPAPPPLLVPSAAGLAAMSKKPEAKAPSALDKRPPWDPSTEWTIGDKYDDKVEALFNRVVQNVCASLGNATDFGKEWAGEEEIYWKIGSLSSNSTQMRDELFESARKVSSILQKLKGVGFAKSRPIAK